MRRTRLIVVTSLLLCNLAFAGRGEWKEVSKSDAVAVTPFEIKKLLNNFKYHLLFGNIRDKTVDQIIAGEIPAILTQLTVTTITMQWVGSTVCPANDPRLQREFYSYRACWSSTNTCEGMGNISSPADPCL